MIERNLGNTERLVRFCLGLAMGIWLLRAEWSALHWLVAMAVAALLLNALTSRCYLWATLNINTRRQQPADQVAASVERHTLAQ